MLSGKRTELGLLISRFHIPETNSLCNVPASGVSQISPCSSTFGKKRYRWVETFSSLRVSHAAEIYLPDMVGVINIKKSGLFLQSRRTASGISSISEYSSDPVMVIPVSIAQNGTQS